MMDINLVLSGIGVTAALVGVVIAYLQLRRQDSANQSSLIRHGQQSSPEYDIAGMDEYSIFVPLARIEGLVADFVDRQLETKHIQRLVRRHGQSTSIVVLEGISGIGKTTLAAKLCGAVCGRISPYTPAWVFCSERSLSLASLLRSVVWDPRLPGSETLYRLVVHNADEPEMIDELIRYFSRNKVLLILDDFHLVDDPGIHRFVDIASKSRLKSVIVITSEMRVESIEKVTSAHFVTIGGLSVPYCSEMLARRGIRIEQPLLETVWQRTGEGIPQALCVLMGLSRNQTLYELMDQLPVFTEDMWEWVKRLIQPLSSAEQEIVKLIAFTKEAVGLELLQRLELHDSLVPALDRLIDRFIVTRQEEFFVVHPLIEGFLENRLDEKERLAYSILVTDHFQQQARDLLLGSDEAASYGLLYLEAFPDYVENESRHIAFFDDLMNCLSANNLFVTEGSKVLNLGAGHGTHDVCFARYGLDVTNIEILDEVAEIGRRASLNLATPIRYIVADMTEPLNIQPDSMDAVFNIGSSFGFEDEDDCNKIVFRNAWHALRPGCPFAFEYVNGVFWSRSVERDVEVTKLENGSVRTKYKIVNPVRNTSLDIITLARKDGSKGYFHHFMHYYSLDEILAMMRDVGFEIVAVYGRRDKLEPFDPDISSGMTVIAKKSENVNISSSA